MLASLRKFRDCRSGNIAVLFAVAAIPVIGVVGAAVDYNRAASNRAKLATAVDAASLALGRQPTMNEAASRSFLESYIAAQLAANGYDGSWTLDSFPSTARPSMSRPPAASRRP